MDTINYNDLAVDLARVLTTGPEATARLAAIPEPWLDEDGEVVDEVKEARYPPCLRTPPPQPEMTLMDWINGNTARARAPFQPWDEIIAGVRAGKWKTQKELAETYDRPSQWITAMKKVVLAQKVMTEAEWSASFVGRYGNKAARRVRPEVPKQDTSNQKGHKTQS